MNTKSTSASLLNSCLLVTLASLPWITSANAQSPGAFSKLNVGDGTGSTTGDGTFVAEGKNYVSPSLPSIYQTTGSRMLWYPRKSAFRAGYGDTTTWNEATMGNCSVAMGSSNTAGGSCATAIGYANGGTGWASTAMGSYNTASGYSATAMGYSNTASSVGSTAMGYSNTAIGGGSTAMGAFNIATEWASTAMGSNNTASGYSATAMGSYTTASSYGETVIGSYNNDISPGNQWIWNPNDPVFQIGNGHDLVWETDLQIDLDGDGFVDQNYEVILPQTYSNALTVYKNGNMELQGDLTIGGPITSAGSPVLTTSSASTLGFLQLSNGVLNIPSTTVSSSSTTGALTVSGGLGVAKDSWINGIQIGRGKSNGSTNTVIGNGALGSSVAGGWNTAIGYQSLTVANASAVGNTATGYASLLSDTAGHANTANGHYSLSSNTTGVANSAFGYFSLSSSTTGNYNSSIGIEAGIGNTTGGNNTFLGASAGKFQTNGSSLLNPNSSVYIGANSRGFTNSDNNSIVIGSNSIGEGANTTVIGNSSTTKTHLYGETTLNSLKVTGQVVISVPQGDISMGIYGN